MVDTNIECDAVDEWTRAKLRLLAELRAGRLKEVIALRRCIEVDGGVAIGISPTDAIINKYNREEMTKAIKLIF